jgi:hypothetical protein
MMKTILNKMPRSLCLLAAGFAGFHLSAAAKEMTAFELIAEGNRYVGEQSKDRVVQVRSDKSLGSLTPVIWHVVYHDPDTSLKAIEVKFGAGKKMDVSRPMRLLEPITKGDQPLTKDQLKVDSDKAIDIASREPLLEKLTLKSARLILERRSNDDSTPVWKVRLWAAKLRNPNASVDIGEVVISADDGKVLKSDLKPDKID